MNDFICTLKRVEYKNYVWRGTVFCPFSLSSFLLLIFNLFFRSTATKRLIYEKKLRLNTEKKTCLFVVFSFFFFICNFNLVFIFIFLVRKVWNRKRSCKFEVNIPRLFFFSKWNFEYNLYIKFCCEKLSLRPLALKYSVFCSISH